MPRGVKWFGWAMVILAFSTLVLLMIVGTNFEFSHHLLMGFLFGFPHMLYGAYLYVTEKKNPVA